MRFHRFALVAGVLALGVAACGDDVQVVEPTPPPPPPPPALSASMAPASAEVMVGSSVVFAVNVSGGAAGEASSWSCASSNTGIATVSVTSAGCQATGVAAGGVTITATVSKGNETANVGSQLTVTAPAAPPPFEASIAPASQSVAVGSSVVFAVNTSGGYTAMMGDMMMAASWTCASSDPAIATVETTDAGCQATGVSGGDVTINVAATDGHATVNLVAQLTVTTDPVDPVQPFSASMAPESATVAVGSNAVFAINTSGGAADATASWTCSSSDDAIATAETTDAGCQATGVAAGGVTINAAVTKGEDSANLASQLTVTAPDVAEPAFVLIAAVTDEHGNTSPSALKNQIRVNISVERGDQTLLGLGLAVDGEIVVQQSFGIATAAPADGPAEQSAGVHEFILSFDSDAYDLHDGHVHVDYPNGEHTLQAGLVVAGSDVPISSNAVTVKFNNDDRLNLRLVTDGNQAMDREGELWHSGAVTGSVVPVMYSGDEVAQVELVLNNQDGTQVRTSRDDGDEMLDDDEIVAPIIDDEAPFEVTWENANASSTNFKRVGGIEPGGIVLNIQSSAFADGSVGPTTSNGGSTPAAMAAVVDKSYFLRLDNTGPTIGDFNLALQFNRNYDITRWVGAGHAFTFSSSSQTPDFTDGGVDNGRSSSVRYQAANYDYFAGTSTSSVTTVAMANTLDESSNNRAYVLGATVRDALGNATTRWWNNTPEGREDDEDDYADIDRMNAHKFGVDLTAPTQELMDGATYLADGGVLVNGGADGTPTVVTSMVGIDYDDPGRGSGFDGSTYPVHTRILRNTPGLSGAATCVVGAWRNGDCDILGDPSSDQYRTSGVTVSGRPGETTEVKGGTVGDHTFATTDGIGYYDVEFAVMDDAGNRADFTTLSGVIDTGPPSASVLVPPAPEAGEPITFSAFVSDNLDLDRVEGFLRVGTDAYEQASASVGSFGMPYEQSTTASESIENLAAGIGAAPAVGFLARVVDQAGNAGYGEGAFTSRTPVNFANGTADQDPNPTGVTDDGRALVYAAPTGTVTTGAASSLCWDADTTDNTDCASGTSTRTTIDFQIGGTETLSEITGDHDGDPDTPDEAFTPDSEPIVNPLQRVVFYVQLAGVDPDGEVTALWMELGEGRSRAPGNADTDGSADTANRQFNWRLSVNASDLGMATGRSAVTADTDVVVRAVGYTADGDAVSVDTAATITLTAPGA